MNDSIHNQRDDFRTDLPPMPESDAPDQEDKVAIDVAEQEFERFADAMDLDIDTSVMDEEDKAAFEGTRRKVVRAIQKGRLVVNDDGEPVFSPVTVDCDPLVFREPLGGTFISMDRKKKNQNVSKMVGIMAEMTGQSEKLFARMKNRDFTVCQSIVTLFLG